MPRPPYLSRGLERRAWDKLPSFAAPCSRRAAGLARMGIAHPPCTPTSSSTSRSMHRAVATHPEATEDVDYKTNASLKPPYSYAELICMAMEASNQPKIPPSAIYKWITDNFCYFRHANATWQNSVRHNLSFNKCFVKVPREKDEPGKGGFWKLDPQHAERLKKDAFRKRRVSLQIHPALTRRVRQAAQGVAGPAAVVCTVESMLSVDKESQKLLEEFEAMTGEHQWSPAGGKAGQKRKLPSPKRMAKASRLSNLALATEEQALPAEE
ncbi:forkhead box protein J1-like, partial [Rhynochetos jubatus]